MVHYLTKEKLKEIKNELELFKGEKRRDVADRLKKAKELGDLSENSEYMEAREEQQWVERRIQELDDTIRNSEVIKMNSGSETIQLGCTFTAKKGDKAIQLTMVGVDETDPENGKISNASPMGVAFLNKCVGDKVVFETPVGKTTYIIESIH